MKALAIVLFVLMDAVMIGKPKWRVFAALSVAAAYLVTGIPPF